MANNPTLDLLTEIHQYNLALKSMVGLYKMVITVYVLLLCKQEIEIVSTGCKVFHATFSTW